MSSTSHLNNNFNKETIDVCCEDHESIFVVTYSSGRTWKVCNSCIDAKEFQLGMTSRTRITS